MEFTRFRLIEEKIEKGLRYIEADRDSFQGVLSEYKGNISDTYHEVRITNEDKYLWLDIEYGKPHPRDDFITHTQTGHKEDNIRTLEQVELCSQVFCMYFYEAKILYMSHSNKKWIIKNILKQITKNKTNFEIDDTYVSVEEFIRLIEEVNEISFTSLDGLFSNDSSKRKALTDLLGYDSPGDFLLKLGYKKGSKKRLLPFIRSLVKEKDNGSLGSLIIKGSNGLGLPIIFNNDAFTSKLQVVADKNEQGKFVSSLVKQKLLENIEETVHSTVSP